MPNLELTYFNAPGRAEPVRIALFLAGLPFTDHRQRRRSRSATHELVDVLGEGIDARLRSGRARCGPANDAPIADLKRARLGVGRSPAPARMSEESPS